MNEKVKIVVIVGPTASGKTSLSITLAKKFDGEVISADSRQVYRGLNLGTGKVTKEEMSGVPHHLLDVAEPQNTYTVSDFVDEARQAIADIVSRGKLPIIVGGSFFYIDALLGKISTPRIPPNEMLREDLEKKSNEELYDLLKTKDERRAKEIDSKNKRRLVRALEIIEAVGAVPETQSVELYDTCTVGIKIPKEKLHENIHTRLFARVDEGMIEEVEQLHTEGLSYDRMEKLGLEYRYIASYLQGLVGKEEMLEELETKIRQYAKRQMTWLKRDADIKWFKSDSIVEIDATINDFLKESD